MKHLLPNFKYVAILLMLSLVFSCSKDDDAMGEQGEQGEAGETGEDGLNCWDLDGDGMGDPWEDMDGDGNYDADDCAGATGYQGDTGDDGLNCWDLDGDGMGDPSEDIDGDGNFDADDCAGENGVTGDTGADGNANVTSLKFDASDFSGSSTSVSIPELTESVLADDAILSYLTSDGINWVPIPCPFNNFQFEFSVHVTFSPAEMLLHYGNDSGESFDINSGDLQELKVIIIESTVIEKPNSSQQIYYDLRKAGVATDDYHEICDYYRLEY